jgi:hypothetical protein
MDMETRPTVYIFIFMGQSNMAGRGIAASAPVVPDGWGYEYRAVTAPDRLFPLKEPFGVGENDPDGVYEPGMKTGSLVSAFVKAAYPLLAAPIAAVSCAKGGSRITEWAEGGAYYKDAARRLQKCRAYLAESGYAVRGSYLVWCQGCTDADDGMPPGVYTQKASAFIKAFLSDGVDGCFLIQIGNHRDKPARYVPIQEAQESLCACDRRILMVSRSFKTCASRGLMKDEFHYQQEAYNEIGAEAGANAARAILQGAFRDDAIPG